MIIVKSPLRISLGGGGTDLPSYYGINEGFLISAAINKYVYVTIMRPFKPGIYLKYSKIEKVRKIDQINHQILRECLKLFKTKKPQIEITTLTDIPAGTGLGSSGSFTVALLKALFEFHKKNIISDKLAELACEIEINKLKNPIGKQDQYISAFGGVREFKFLKNGKVISNNLKISRDNLSILEENLLLFFTGFSRDANNILKKQNDETKKNNNEMIENLNFIKKLGIKSKKSLEKGDFSKFAELMNIHWEYKRTRSKNMSNSEIDKTYKMALKNGAIGGKLVGAGGGGFLMFYSNDKEKLRFEMKKKGFEEVRFNFDFNGTQTIIS